MILRDGDGDGDGDTDCCDGAVSVSVSASAGPVLYCRHISDRIVGSITARIWTLGRMVCSEHEYSPGSL